MTQPTPVEPSADQPAGPIRLGLPYCPNPHDWSRYSLNEIAAVLQRHSSATGWAGVAVWADIQSLCQTLAERLDKALKDLEAQWPRTQEAARAFQTWGGSLVRAMETTAKAAGLNVPVPANINAEIERARDRINHLKSEQAHFQHVEQTYGSIVANAAYARDRLFEGDLDFGGWRAALDRQAREVMADLERKISTYALDLYTDPPYKPPVGEGRGDTVLNGEIASETVGGGWGGGGFAAAGGGWSGAWMPPSGVAVSGGASISGSNPAPVGGSGPAAPAPLDSSGNTVLDGVVPGGSGGGTVSPAGTSAAGPGGGFVDTPLGRVLAPGGVIGSPAAGGIGAGTTPGGSGPASTSATAGLAAGAGGGGRPVGGPGLVPFVPPMTPGPTGTSMTRTAGRRSRPGLPSVFDTPDGPPGVIQPPAEPANHDPGPNVIGIDR
mgnify:CR=1 FL=1